MQGAEAAEDRIPRQLPHHTGDHLQPAPGFLNGKVLTSAANWQHSETLLSHKGRDGLWSPGFRGTTPPYFSSPEPQLSEPTLC